MNKSNEIFESKLYESVSFRRWAESSLTGKSGDVDVVSILRKLRAAVDCVDQAVLNSPVKPDDVNVGVRLYQQHSDGRLAYDFRVSCPFDYDEDNALIKDHFNQSILYSLGHFALQANTELLEGNAQRKVSDLMQLKLDVIKMHQLRIISKSAKGELDFGSIDNLHEGAIDGSGMDLRLKHSAGDVNYHDIGIAKRLLVNLADVHKSPDSFIDLYLEHDGSFEWVVNYNLLSGAVLGVKKYDFEDACQGVIGYVAHEFGGSAEICYQAWITSSLLDNIHIVRAADCVEPVEFDDLIAGTSEMFDPKIPTFSMVDTF